MGFRIVTRKTDRRELYLFGTGIAHSQSPALYSTVFARLDLPWVYEAVDCATDADFHQRVADSFLFAANVTMPFKREALKLAHVIDDAALKAGGANLLIRDGSSLRAYNTDGKGAALFLARKGIRLDGAMVAVCGTGVTARAIASALEEESAQIFFLSRTQSRIADRYGTPQAQAVLRAADIIVDATPLGMNRSDGTPFDTSILSSRHIVLDVVYGQGETALRRACRRAHCCYFDGEGMLIGQAAIGLPLILDAACVACSIGPGDFFAMMEENRKLEG